MALRGAPQDFEEWAALGNREWSFAKVLPFYRKLENDRDFKGDFHGRNGPIAIERTRRELWQSLGHAFYQACRAAGFAEATDHNTPTAAGVGPSPLNRQHRLRISTAIGYLDPARHRINLTIRPQG